MSTQFIMRLGSHAMINMALVVAPLILVSFVVGLIISLFQAVTQIQEMTLTFVPKLLSMGMALLFFGSWMLTKIMTYTKSILGGLDHLIGGS